ncbi:MAG: formimidoylglutamate deiminase [Pseudomonadota bacterium]
MSAVLARRAYLAGVWSSDVRITIDVEHSVGTISQIETSAAAQPNDVRVDTLLPALSNLHSHSFQRAMAGMTEYRGSEEDSFWSWRTLMYRFLNHLTPDHIQAIAAQVFMEMQEAGYAAVGEFHYVHHQAGGQAYAALAETSGRIAEAALETGIGLTLLPVLYAYGGAGEKPLSPAQARFGNDWDHYQRLTSDAAAAVRGSLAADSCVGYAPHSLRAVSPEMVRSVDTASASQPIHIHIAEQTKEVEEIQEQLGAPPVQWLLENAAVDGRWCLVHATHMTQHETKRFAQTGAVAGLCPMTEANLGDGIFPADSFLQTGGVFGLGSDSNVRISLTEELRLLEYGQRLRDRARNVLSVETPSVGQTLYLGAAHGGARALGRRAGAIEVGAVADLVAIDSSADALCALKPEQLFDGLCFAADDGVVTDVWSAGRHRVRGGRHLAREQISARYKAVVAELISLI